MKYKIKRIKNDASFREFYRISVNQKSSILVFSKKERFKNLIIYCAINQILNKNNIKAPALIKQYFNKGIMEISDLGKESLFDLINKKKNKFLEYTKILDLLIKMQKIKIKQKIIFKKNKIFIKKYDKNNLHKESDLFFKWYLKYFCKSKKNKTTMKSIKKELSNVYNKLSFKNDTFVHRDFHASNILIHKKKYGIIDSQDAIMGSQFYDVASLIDDVRVKISYSVRNKLFKYYFKKKVKEKNKFKLSKTDFDILSVQRNLKILGIFVRLSVRDNKHDYLKYLPNTWKLIEFRLKNPIFRKLKKLLYKSVSKQARKRNYLL
tara:strand:- start:548 stop:1510 length:963 start_codon:yes stop_codon:yes gene_type:complete